MSDALDKYKRAQGLETALQYYSQFQWDSLQETVDKLASLVSSVDYLSDEFFDALVVEMERHLENYRTHSKVIKTIVTEKPREVEELVWDDDPRYHDAES